MADHDVTRLLSAWRAGDAAALEQLTPLVYRHLQRMAHSAMRGERAGHTVDRDVVVYALAAAPCGARDEPRRTHGDTQRCQPMSHE